jgi:hypothetical protein
MHWELEEWQMKNDDLFYRNTENIKRGALRQPQNCKNHKEMSLAAPSDALLHCACGGSQMELGFEPTAATTFEGVLLLAAISNQ